MSITPVWLSNVDRAITAAGLNKVSLEDLLTLRELSADYRRMRAAVVFYADPKNYSNLPADDGEVVERAVPMSPDEAPGCCDCGDIARKALCP